MAILLIAAIIKIYLLKKGAKNIAVQVKKILDGDTNALITICSNDRDIKALAIALNNELKSLRASQIKYGGGDKKIKDTVTNLSHDIRTPLTVINGYVERLQSEDLSKNSLQYIEIIKRRLSELSALTEELFKYSVIVDNPTENNYENVCINEILEESVLSFYTAFKERGIIPLSKICDSLLYRKTDKKKLCRIFANIISNALKYAENDFTVMLSENGIVSFENTASGLSKIDTDHLFDRYFTVKSNAYSTGLGLSIAKQLSQELGATLSADYNANKLTIKMVLPL